MSENTVPTTAASEQQIADAFRGALGGVADAVSGVGNASGQAAQTGRDTILNDPLRGGPFTRATGPLNPAEDPSYQAYLRSSGASARAAAAARQRQLDEIARQQGRFVQDADEARGRARQDSALTRERGLRDIAESFEARGLFRSGRRQSDQGTFAEDTDRTLARSIYDINLDQHRRVEDDQLRIDAINEAAAAAAAARGRGQAAALERARRDALLRDAALGIIPDFGFNPVANQRANQPIDLESIVQDYLTNNPPTPRRQAAAPSRVS